jgi:hypothetical protein
MPVTTARTFVSLEQLHIFTPLGIRFWDAALERVVTDGLEVRAYPAGRPQARRTAVLSRSGVYAFHGLPGLHAVEYPADADAMLASPPQPQRFMVEVEDRAYRFLPVVFGVDVPYAGVLPTNTLDAQGRPLPGFYLFSAPARPVLPTQAVVRVQVAEAGAALPGRAQSPAAHALLELELPDGRVLFGIADEEGRAAIILPYPAFAPAAGGFSPLNAAGLEFQQSWTVHLRVRYAPSRLAPPVGSRLPELRSIFAQTPALIWTSAALSPGQPVDELTQELRFGEELVIRSGGSSTLLVSALESPL